MLHELDQIKDEAIQLEAHHDPDVEKQDITRAVDYIDEVVAMLVVRVS